MEIVPSGRNKRRRSSIHDNNAASVRRQCDFVPHRHVGDIDISGSANVHIGDHLHFHDSKDALQNAASKLQESLCFPRMHERYESLQDAADGTFTWILSSDSTAARSLQRCYADSFLGWFRSGSSPFWMSGKPGSGKSTLMKYLAENIQSETIEALPPGSIVVSFFFWVNGDDLQRSKIGCMRSLLWQLLQNPSTREIASQRCQARFSGAWTAKVLRTILSAILDEFSGMVVVFIDGLDESGDHDDMLEFVRNLQTTSNIRVCVSSRPDPLFTAEWQSCPRLRLQDLNYSDINHVIQVNFLEDAKVIALGKKLDLQERREELRKLEYMIQKKAEGVFLWVRLVIKDLLKGITQKDDLVTLFRRLERLPNEVYALYNDMLLRAQHDFDLYKDDMALYLSLALHREMDVVEFCLAIDDHIRARYMHWSIFEPDAKAGADLDCETVMTWIHTRTAGLLQVSAIGSIPDWQDQSYEPSRAQEKNECVANLLKKYTKRIVGFIHRTAQDFLQSTIEGMSLLRTSKCTYPNAARICFETKLVREMVLTGLVSHFVHPSECIIFECKACSDRNIYEGLKDIGKQVFENMRKAGILHVDESVWTYPRWASSGHGHRSFPASKYALIDLVPALLLADRYLTAEMMLLEYKCMADTKYLNMVLVKAFARVGYAISIKGKEIRRFLKVLFEKGANLQSPMNTHIGESIHPLGEVVPTILAPYFGPIEDACRLLKLEKSDLTIQVTPSCIACHGSWHLGNASGDYQIWGNFCAADVWRPGRQSHCVQGANDFVRSEDDRILVLASCRSSEGPSQFLAAPELRSVTLTDSNLIIDTLNCQNEFVHHFDVGVFELPKGLNSRDDSKASYRILSEVFSRSERLTFATAMERLGKSRETIRKLYENEAVLMAREHPSIQEGWEEWFWGTGDDKNEKAISNEDNGSE